jgi:hypothetical protein
MQIRLQLEPGRLEILVVDGLSFGVEQLDHDLKGSSTPTFSRPSMRLDVPAEVRTR